VKKLADPKWEGRGLGTAGIDSAANWIAARMQTLGLKPGGEKGTWFQSVEVTTGVEVVAPSGIRIQDTHVLASDDYQPIGFSTNGTVTAPVVFAGYGISAPGFDYDDYAGIDVRDKLVLVLSQEPGEMDSTSKFDGNVNTAHSELRTKAIAAREHGAIGMLVVNGPRWHSGEPLPRARSDGGSYMTSGLLAARVSERLAEQMLAGSGLKLVEAQAFIEDAGRPHSVALRDSVTLTVSLKRTRANTRNVVGWLPGRDTTRTLVVGAHYDHLGYGGESSLSPDASSPHVGADDNASGTAALLGLACALRSEARGGKPPEHNLVFAAFTGEESGLIGSSHFVDDPTRPIESVEAMINFDMVGRLRDDRLMIMGAGTAQEFGALLDNVNRAGAAKGAKGAFTLRTSSDGYGPSDHSSFYKRDIPVLMLFTGAHADYHKPSDTWDKINVSGLERVTKFATALVETLDARPRVQYVRAKADSSTGRIAGGGGYGAYLGTIPDYMQTEGGVLLSGVRTGSPADSAGLKGGDVIVRFDGIRVDNIYDYTFALRSRKPGQKVHITVKRAGADVDLLATLGRRTR
jgi:Peptidase family M28/PDZ domain/PA domain